MSPRLNLLTATVVLTSAVLAGCGGTTTVSTAPSSTDTGSATTDPAHPARSTTIPAGHASTSVGPSPVTPTTARSAGDPDAYCAATRRFVAASADPAAGDNTADGAPAPDDPAFDAAQAEAEHVAELRNTFQRALIPLGEMTAHAPSAIAHDLDALATALRGFLEATKDAKTLDDFDNTPEAVAIEADPDLQAAADRVSDYTSRTCGIELDNANRDE